MKTFISICTFLFLFSYNLIAQSSFINVIDFDGDGDYASTVNEPIFPTGNGTIEAWINVRNIRSGGQLIGDAFFAKNKENWNESDFYMWFETASGRLKATIQSSPNNPPIRTDVQSNISFRNYYNIWFHTAFTWGNSGMKLFINGVLQTSQSSVTHTAMTNLCDFYIGTHGYKLNNGNYNLKDFFNGQIDEVRIWNFQKTSEQIFSLWNEPLDSAYYISIDSGLVGYWKFDELEDLGVRNDGVDDVRDFSIFHNHIDLEGDAHLVPENIIVPVELISFTAELNKNGNVILEWETATELNNLGFEIEKSYDELEFFTVGFVKGTGSSTQPRIYSFKDYNNKSGKAFYRLKQLDYNGTYEYSDVIQIDISLISKFELFQNHPNPFNPITIIKYQVPESNYVTIKVYDILGNEIAKLVDETKTIGIYEVEFNTNNIASGVYFYQIVAGEFSDMKKMILLK